jgi:hypothetical protein
VSWSGTTPGSAIASYDVYVSDDGGAFTLWQSATATSSAVYPGVVGHSYAFVATASDEVGNLEAFPTKEQASTTIVGPPSGSSAPPPNSTTTTTTTTTEPVSKTSRAVERPRLTRLSRRAGPKAGGIAVLIHGEFFADVTVVRFGTHKARFEVLSAAEIRAVAPRGTGSVAVLVTTGAGTSPRTKSDRFTYLAKSEVLGLSPATGPKAGGTAVLVRGAWFMYVKQVRFGSRTARFTVVSAEEIRAVAPPGSGTVRVAVVTAAGTSAARASDRFVYAARR